MRGNLLDILDSNCHHRPRQRLPERTVVNKYAVRVRAIR